MNQYNKNKISTYHYEVSPFSEDATGHLSLNDLGFKLLAAASTHASENGFGYELLIQKNLAWVLSRLTLYFYDRPKPSEKYCISTWVNKVYRHFTDRLFEITNEKGKLLIEGISTWSCINIDTRHAVDLEEMSHGQYQHVMTDKTIQQEYKRSRIKVDGNQSPILEKYIGFSQLDINQHVNSIRYLEMILDLFSAKYLKDHPFRRIEIQYCNEAYEKDLLSFFTETKENNIFQVEIKKANTPILRCELEFTNP